MQSLRRGFELETTRLAARHRVAFLTDMGAIDALAGPTSIISSLPAVRLYIPPIPCIKRQRLRIETAGGGQVTVLAHCRPALFEPGPPLLAVRWAVTRFGRRLPVAWADPRTRSVQLMLRPHGATLVSASTPGSPAAFLVQTLLGPALEALMGTPNGTSVGEDILIAARSLMERGFDRRSRIVTEDLAVLEYLTSSGSLPEALSRRLRRLRELASTEKKRTVTHAQVRTEVDRLRRLVTSRAYGGLRLGSGGLDGLLNPRIGECGRVFRAIVFRLSPAGELSLWQPDRVRGRGALQCLGRGARTMRRLLEASDLYGAMDLVPNYIETNDIGLACAEEAS